MASHKDTEDPPEFFDIHRRAHRVFHVRKGADRFNPFRHIPWFSEVPKDLAPGIRRISLEELDPFRIWKFKIRRFRPYEPYTVKNQVQRTILTSWINVFLICAPIGIYLSSRGGSPESFVFNYLAEFPLWFMCDYALEELELYIGRTASDLLDIFTNNTVQVISSFLLLKARKVSLLQTSLVGGILNNILMLLGLSFFIGGVARGWTNHEQRFNRLGAQGSSSLLSIAATSLLIPTAVKQLNQTAEDNLVLQSRGVAVVLLFVYSTYTFCQMVTHKKLYMSPGNERPDEENLSGICPFALLPDGSSPRRDENAHGSSDTIITGTPDMVSQDQTIQNAAEQKGIKEGVKKGVEETEKAINGGASGAKKEQTEENRVIEFDGPHLRFSVAAFVFVVSIVLLFFCIDGTVQSIAALMDDKGLSETFVGLMLLPIPNCDFAPISLAVDDSLEQTMKYTVGRSIQTALLVEPMVVLIAWWTGVGGVTLAFDGFEVVSLFTTILLLNFLVIDAKVHWVHGVLLLSDWVLIGIAAYFVTPELSSS